MIPVPVRFRSAALLKNRRNVDFIAFLLFFRSFYFEHPCFSAEKWVFDYILSFFYPFISVFEFKVYFTSISSAVYCPARCWSCSCKPIPRHTSKTLLYLYVQRIQQTNHLWIGEFRILYLIRGDINQIPTTLSKISFPNIASVKLCSLQSAVSKTALRQIKIYLINPPKPLYFQGKSAF